MMMLSSGGADRNVALWGNCIVRSPLLGFCGPRGCGQPLLFLSKLNLWYILVHAVWMMLPWVFFPLWPSSRVVCCSLVSKSASRLLKYRSRANTHVSISRLRIGVDLKAPVTIFRLLLWALPKTPVIPLVAGSPPFLVGMWKEDAL